MSLIPSRNRPLRVCYLHHDARFVDDALEQIEFQIAQVHSFKMVELDNIDSPQLYPCDLLVLIAHHLSSEHLVAWIKGLSRRLQQKNIWIPSIILSDASARSLTGLIPYALRSNWYFDIIHPDHIPSLPWRMSNLIRIHDHLGELCHYEQTLTELEAKVTRFSEQARTT